MPKKTERGSFGIFQHPLGRKTSKKIEELLFWGIFSKKHCTMPKKTERGDSLVSPGIILLRGEKGKTFLVQFLVSEGHLY